MDNVHPFDKFLFERKKYFKSIFNFGYAITTISRKTYFFDEHFRDIFENSD